jgi:hypothetical protein
MNTLGVEVPLPESLAVLEQQRSSILMQILELGDLSQRLHHGH